MNGTTSQPPNDERKLHVLLGVTGSVAAVKSPEIATRLVKDLNVEVRVVLTNGGTNFWNKAKEYNPKRWEEFQELSSKESGSEIIIYEPQDEWQGWNRLGDPVLHIDLRDWADVAVIAPLSAHSLAKLAHGLCDDTLSCVLRAWDLGHGVRPAKPWVVAPAMNTAMWVHPLTKTQIQTIQQFWKGSGCDDFWTVSPQAKVLACGEVGNGGMASVDTIVDSVRLSLSSMRKEQK